MINSQVPKRGDIIKLEFGAATQFTADSIKRVLDLRASGMSFEDIAATINNELKQQGREEMGYRPTLVLSPLEYNQISSIVLACPITNQRKGLSFEVPLPEGMKTTGVILSDQVKAFDWRARKFLFVEEVEQDVLEEVQAKLEVLIL